MHGAFPSLCLQPLNRLIGRLLEGVHIVRIGKPIVVRCPVALRLPCSLGEVAGFGVRG